MAGGQLLGLSVRAREVDGIAGENVTGDAQPNGVTPGEYCGSIHNGVPILLLKTKSER